MGKSPSTLKANDAIFIPVGGGGLIAGVSAYIEISFVQTLRLSGVNRPMRLV